MRFEIKSPWTQWLVRTKINDVVHLAKVDGGSSLTLIGFHMTVLLGIEKEKILSSPHVEYYDVSNATMHRAFRVPLGDIKLPFGRHKYPMSHIFVPFRVLSKTEVSKLDKEVRNRDTLKICFTLRDNFLAGTDFLRQFQLHLTFEQSMASGKVTTTQWLELIEHKLQIPPAIYKEQRFRLKPEAVNVQELPMTALHGSHAQDEIDVDLEE